MPVAEDVPRRSSSRQSGKGATAAGAGSQAVWGTSVSRPSSRATAGCAPTTQTSQPVRSIPTRCRAETRRGTVADVTDLPTPAATPPSASGLRVRPSCEEDGPTLRDIDTATWSSLVSPAPAPPDDAPFFTERVRPEDVLVCEVEGSSEAGAGPGGYVGITQDLPIPSHEHVLQIGGIAVAPWAQGRGVGQALVEAAVDEARRRGAAKLTLRVLGGNGAARRLYERCGFVVEGVLVGEFVLDGVAVDDVLMARRLD